DASPGGRRRRQRLRVHDLVSRLPDPGVVPHNWLLTGIGRCGLPVAHDVVHPAAVEVGADWPLEIVHEGVDLLVWRSPVEVAVLSAVRLGVAAPRRRPAAVAARPWSAAASLPVQRCDVAGFVAAAALLWRELVLVEVAYFWGLGGTLQAVLTPDLKDHFPSF